MSPGIKPVSRDQIVALQSLCNAWHSRMLTDEDPRSARLAWASEQLGRSVSSFSDLSANEARQLIDLLKTSLGQKLKQQPQPWRRVNARDRAHEAGTAGRRGNRRSDVIHMASPDDLARIDEALQRLDWTREQFETWLKSGSSPLGRREDSAIRTVAEANKVWWALKAMMVRSGVWKQQKKAV